MALTPGVCVYVCVGGGGGGGGGSIVRQFLLHQISLRFIG